MKMVFTTALVENGNILFWSEHAKRLQIHSRRLGFKAPLIVEGDFYKKIPLVGLFRLRVTVRENQPWEYDWSPYEQEDSPVELMVIQSPYEGRFAKVKSVCRKQLRKQAREAGFSDAVTIDKSGYLLEATYANIYWIANGVLYTPSPELDLLWGLTIARIVSNAPKVVIGHFRIEDIPPSSRVWICNCLAKTRVASIKTHQSAKLFS